MASSVYNNEAEQFLLASILRNPESYWEINHNGLTSRDFANRQHVVIFSAIESAARDKVDPTVPYVIENLRKANKPGAVEYVAELQSVPCSVKQAVDYSTMVKGLAIARRLQNAGAKIIDIASEERSDYHSALAEASNLIRTVEDTLPPDERSPGAGDILRRMDVGIIENKIPITFSDTLQSMTGGFAHGHFWVIGGFSSTGKSAFAANIALDAISAGKKTAIVSAEMTQEQYMVRMLAIESGISQMDIQNRVTIGIPEHEAMVSAKQKLADAPLYIYDNLYRMPQIRTELQRQKNQQGLDVLILDYIQNVSVTGDEVADAREVALECQRIAKDLDCAVIAFSQLSNAQAKYELDGGDDNYYSLKGHGAIRDAADVILTLHRDRVAKSSALRVKFRKNRHGPMSDFTCHFNLENGRIEERPIDEDLTD
jgi:replicative DNA helicase